MSAVKQVQSVCECQALLEAELDERRLVLRGFARRGAGNPENAPANNVGAGERVDIVWQCPFCGRNTLRSFHFEP